MNREVIGWTLWSVGGILVVITSVVEFGFMDGLLVTGLLCMLSAFIMALTKIGSGD